MNGDEQDGDVHQTHLRLSVFICG